MKFLNSACDFHDHGKIVLKVHKIVPRGGVFVYFLLQGRNFEKIFCPGAGNLTTLKNSPGGMLVLGIDWCIIRNALTILTLIRLNVKENMTTNHNRQ